MRVGDMVDDIYDGIYSCLFMECTAYVYSDGLLWQNVNKVETCINYQPSIIQTFQYNLIF
jgi:hypothetical protein